MNGCPHMRVHLRSLIVKSMKRNTFIKNAAFDKLTTPPVDHIKLLHQFSFGLKWGVFINDGQFCEELLRVICDTLSCSC